LYFVFWFFDFVLWFYLELGVWFLVFIFGASLPRLLREMGW
jgi:hypothetical protein